MTSTGAGPEPWASPNLNQRPLSVLMAEKVADLRAWAEDRCVPAD